MTKTTIQIEGMMCGHCEAHVNDTIRNAFDVKKVTSSHTKNETVILSEEPLSETALREALAPTGYTVLAIHSEEESKGNRLFGFKK